VPRRDRAPAHAIGEQDDQRQHNGENPTKLCVAANFLTLSATLEMNTPELSPIIR
jgi:hypothetical protein